MTNVKRKVAFTLPGGESTWTGGLNYLRSLLHAVNAVRPDDIGLYLYLGTRPDATGVAWPPGVALERTSALDTRSPTWWADELARRHLWRSPLLRRRFLRDDVAVHSHGLPSFQSPVRTIGWIADFQHLHLPHLFSAKERELRDDLFRRIGRCSDVVVLSSENAKGDFVQFAPEARSKARVLQFAALPQDHLALSRRDIERLYGASRTYFYVPNQFWVHKNHRRLIDALALAVQMEPRLLVLCSGSTSDTRNPQHFVELKQRVSDAGLQDNLRFLGLIPYGHIAPLMMQATAVVNPSLFEGWSTTVEEAKALGVPLIVSDIAVHREQCGGSAAYFDPLNAEELAEILIRHWRADAPDRQASETNAALRQHGDRISRFGKRYLDLIDELTAA